MTFQEYYLSHAVVFILPHKIKNNNKSKRTTQCISLAKMPLPVTFGNVTASLMVLRAIPPRDSISPQREWFGLGVNSYKL